MFKFKGDIEIYSDDSYNVDSDEEYSYDSSDSEEENSDGKMRIRNLNA